MDNNIEIKKYYNISWKYARLNNEYDNMKKIYNNLKNNILNEYIDYFINIEKYNYNDSVIMANLNIKYSNRLNLKWNELINIKNNINNIESDYINLYNNYINNN